MMILRKINIINILNVLAQVNINNLQNDDDTSGVLSRQRKYKYKSKIVCRMKLMMMKIM